MARRTWTVAAVATMLAATACGSTDDGPFLEPAPTTSVGATSTTTGPDVPTEVIAIEPGDAVPGEAPDLVLATADGPARWSLTTGLEVVAATEDDLRHVVDDGAGGLVGLTVDEQLLASAWWWPDQAEPVLLRSQGGLALHDSTVRNDSVAVVITYSPIDTPEPSQVLDLLDLATTSSRTVTQVGDATVGAADAAAADDGIAVVRVDGDCTEVVEFDDTGEPTATRLHPPRRCTAEDPAYGPLALTDDGATLVVASTDDDGTWSLVRSDRRASTLTRYELADDIETITGLDVSDRFVALTTGVSTHLIDLDEARVSDLGVVATNVQVVAPA